MDVFLASNALQWGRDHLIAEMLAYFGEVGRGLRASMGPRSSDRGNVDPYRSTTRRRRSLQWGRDHLIAEINCMCYDGESEAACFNGAAII